MKSDTYFDHYRLAKEYDGAPVTIGTLGGATLFKGSDTRSGAPVVVTLLPVEQVPEDARDHFEEQARAALLLDHVNIVRTVEFGREGDDYAFVSEYPQGETLQTWVHENGPMPADAVLRVALQVVSALSAASFHGVVHRGLQPSNILIVSGQTAEGGWPAVKLMNFPTAGMTRGTDAAEFASPEQLGEGKVDFRSEMYSLGGTLCFLLTGSFYSAEPRSLQTKRFAKPLRHLITPMLRQNPNDRPHDPILFSQELRSCLQRVERRQSLARRFGIPFVPVSLRKVRPPKVRPQPQSILAAALTRPVPTGTAEIVPRTGTRRLWPRRALVLAALLLAAATVAAMLLPAPVSMLLHRNRDVETMGVPIGVAQTTTSATATEPASAQVPSPPTAVATNTAPVAAPHQAVSASVQPERNAAEVVSAESSTSPAQIVSTDTSSPVPAEATGRHQPAENQGPAVKEVPSSVANVVANESAVHPLTPAEGPAIEATQPIPQATPSRIARENETASEDANRVDSSVENVKRPNDSDDRSSTAAATGSSKLRSLAAKTKPASTTTTATSRPRSASTVRRSVSSETFAPENGVRVVHPGRPGSVRAQFAGFTPDGGLILRFPNGQTAVVPPPPGEYIPANQRNRRSRRVIIERRTAVEPPPPYQPFQPGLPGDE